MYIRVETTDWISQGLRNSSQDKKYIIYISAREMQIKLDVGKDF